MDFNEYQDETLSTAIYPGRGKLEGLMYCGLGLGEAGEIQGKIKKMLRDGYDKDSRGENADKYLAAREAIKGELGDLLWYIARTADELDIYLNDVAASNLEKLRSRKDRGVLGGSGDNR